MIIFENIGVGWGLAPTFYFADFSPYFKWGQSFVMPSLLCVGMLFCLLFLLVAVGQNGGSKPPPYIKTRNFRPILNGELTTFDAVNVTPIPQTSALLMLRSAEPGGLSLRSCATASALFTLAITGRGSLFGMH